MKFFATLCLFGVVATGLAMPQDQPSIGFPIPLPERPDFHAPIRPSAPHGDRHSHMDHPHIGPELSEFMHHMRDFVKLYPRREIREIIRQHIRDPELRATMRFFRTPEFKNIMHTIAETPEFQAIRRYFGEANWPWIQNTIVEAISELEHETSAVSKRSTGGLSGLLDAVIAILPQAQLRALFDEKVANSAVFRSVIEIVTSAELKSLIETARNAPVVREQVAVLLQNGIDVDKIVESKMALVGY